MLLLLFLLSILTTPADAVPETSEDRDAAGVLVAVEAAARPLPPDLSAALETFYAERGGRPAWLLPGRWWRSAGPSRQAEDLLEALADAARYGLEPERYEAAALARRTREAFRKGPPEPGLHDEIEVALSVGLLRLLGDLSRGRIAPDVLGTAWNLDRPRPDLAAALQLAARDGIDAAIRSVQPRHTGYHALLEALDRYRRIAEAGGWSSDPVAPSDDASRRALRRRLAEEGYEDGDLDRAIRSFQRSHGIAEDGVVGVETLSELAVSAEARVRQIALNLERWRWVPGELARPRVEVNVPAFDLALIDARGDTALAMRVVVGAEAKEPDGEAEEGAASDGKTPVFQEQIETIVFNPYWNVPRSIARDEIVPALIEDPDELQARDLEVIRGWGDEAEPLDAADIDWEDLLEEDSDLRLRQRPGPRNALGRIKFLLPNRMHIYLHDTPEDALFEETDRDFSHGCIRVEKPVALARALLAGEGGWSDARIQEALESDERMEVRLPEPVATYVGYWTAVADGSGGVAFHQDLYGFDAAMEAALAGRSAE